jgi:hypothetical protein
MSGLRGFFPEPPDFLRSAIGRPRTALWLGSESGADLAREMGATVTVVTSLPSGPGAPKVDLVFVTEAAARTDLTETLRAAHGRLEDGGHVVVEAQDPSAQIERVVDAGFEPLWVQPRLSLARAMSQPLVLVARRRPERRKLSLTVGMISMNEQEAVGGVIQDIHRNAPDAEILLVDSSKDDTPVIAEKLGARVLRQFPPRGYGPAMTRLLYSATTDVIVTMDCDGTYPASRILELHRLLEEGMDLVNASRTHRRPDAMPFANYVANRVFALSASLVHGFSTTDVHSGMRAYRTSMLRGMYVPEKGAALPVALVVVPARHGYRVKDVNIDYHERIGTTTLNRFDSTMWTARRIVYATLVGGRATH